MALKSSVTPLAGGGVIASGAYPELRALADKYRIPVTMSMPGIGAYPSAAPLSMKAKSR